MKNMRMAAVISWLIILSVIIITLFWYNEWVYALPTPVPLKYKPVNLGQEILLSGKFQTKPDKPLFLHFFNPDCPCSRFNISHFKSLVNQYNDKVIFTIVVISNKAYTVKQIQDKFLLNTPVFFDKSIAVSCGVYSTPQAVIIDVNHKLYYRGNYNRSRYCADEKSNYAQIALDGLITNKHEFIFDQYALKAYGCQLPNCIR